MSFPRYPEYKDSGVEWLGEVPAHWEIIQSRRLFRERKDRATNGDRQLTASQKHGVIYQDDFMSIEGHKVMQVIHGADILKRAEPNDFVISMRSFQGGIEWCGLAGSISSAYVMLIPENSVVPGYFRYLFKSSRYVQALQSTTNLVRDGQALRFANFVLVDLPVVPEQEQLCIAMFLDRETAKIDALVAEQEKLIALLQEKRQAVISHGVTKGLNPNVPMKDSGVEWLGEVPGHWEVDRLKASIISSRNGIWGDESKGDENDIPCVRVADFDRQKLRVALTEPTIRNVTAKEREGRTLNKGDLLLEKSGGGENQPVGCVVLYDDARPAVCSNFVARVQLAPDMVSSFWRYVHAAAYTVRLTTGSINQTSGIQNLDQDRYFNERAAFPPPEEQTAIATFLDHETAKLDTLMTQARTAITLLQERRTALISAAVIGQIDVRGLVGGANAPNSIASSAYPESVGG